jgi:hypothetical protein
MKRSGLYLGTALLLALAVVAGCAGRGPILVDFQYQPAAGYTPAETPSVTVAVAPFKDERGKTDSVTGRRFNSTNDKVNNLVVQGTVSEKVTEAFKTALRLRDIPINETATWDQTEEGIPAVGNLVLSGQIKTLWVESVSAFANTKVTAKVEIRVVAADPVQKKIVRALTVTSSIERQNVVYSTAFTQETMAEALTAAINKVFNDEELMKRLK